MPPIKAPQRTEIIMVLSLEDERACEWLEANASKGPTRHSDDQKHKVVSWALARRSSKVVRLTVAKCGSHVPTLQKLFTQGSRSERLAVLSNIAVGPCSSFIDRGEFFLPGDMAMGILERPNSREFQVFLNNPYIDRGWLADVLKDWDATHGLTNEGKAKLVRIVSSNPVISESYNDTYIDGFSEYSHNRLNFELVELLQTVPVTVDWAFILSDLLPKLYLPFVPDFDVDLLERWQHPDGKNERYFDPFDQLRRHIVKYLIRRDHRSGAKNQISLDHPDSAVRNGLYSALRPNEFFKGIRLGENFEYPSFAYLGEYELTAAEDAVVQICKNCFEADKNDFIESLLENVNFWRRPQERKLLSTLCWDLAEDPVYLMDLPNMYRANEAHYIREHPEWFSDEEVDAEFPEDMPIEPRLDQIRQDISELKLAISELKGSSELDESSRISDVSLGSIQERLSELDELVGRRLEMSLIGIKTLIWIVLGVLFFSLYLPYL